MVGIILAGLFVLLISLRGIASFYTDFLWFQSLELESVWRTVLGAKFSLTIIGGLVFFLLCAGNLLIAERLAPAFRLPSSGDDDLIERYHELVGERAGLVRFSVSIPLALMVGASLGVELERVDPVPAPGRLRHARTPRSARTSGSTSSACRSSPPLRPGCSRR